MEKQTEKSENNIFLEEMEKKKKKNKKNKNISFQDEILRKSIHMLSLLIPILYTYLSKDTAALVLVFMAIFAVIFDVSSKLIPFVGNFYFKIFGFMLRKHERKTKEIYLNGASWVLIGAFITVFIFPKIIAITALTILVISDLSAALIGRKFGKTPFFDKSLEGTITFFITGSIIILYLGYFFMLPVTYYIFGFLAAAFSAIVEAGSNFLKMDDNLSIPLSIGIVMWLGGWWMAVYNITYLDIL
jgi:dolichol kinase